LILSDQAQLFNFWAVAHAEGGLFVYSTHFMCATLFLNFLVNTFASTPHTLLTQAFLFFSFVSSSNWFPLISTQ